MNNIEWINAKDKFPPEQIDVIVRVKNKNKPDGIYLYDICRYFNSDGWANSERAYTWEEIVDWKFINNDDYIKYNYI